MLSRICAEFQCLPSAALQEDPEWVFRILDVRYASVTKEIMGTSGAKPSEAQSAYWAMLLEAYYGEGEDEPKEDDEAEFP